MGMDRAVEWVSRIKGHLHDAMVARRWALLRERGLRVGEDVYLPESTILDPEYFPLITIGDSCSFGADCIVLAHDPEPEPTTGMIRVAPVTLEASCHIGARTTVLPGVTIGPRTIVAANSVVTRSLPPETVCAGNPARVFSSLDQYLAGHRERLRTTRRFRYDAYDIRALTPERRAELVAAVTAGDAYIVGGRSAELRGAGGSARTPTTHHHPTPPEPLPEPPTA